MWKEIINAIRKLISKSATLKDATTLLAAAFFIVGFIQIMVLALVRGGAISAGVYQITAWASPFIMVLFSSLAVQITSKIDE